MHFTVEAQRILGGRIVPGDIVIDATAGNGHDTVFLAERVGDQGTVYAIDIQSTAIEQVRLRLADLQLLARARLHISDHKHLKQIVAPEHQGAVASVVFNLGYLPFGDKSITTTRESSIAAIDGAASLLRTNGLMTILAYVGHPGGREEAQAVQEWLEAHADTFAYQDLRDPLNPDSPILWVAEKKNVASKAPDLLETLAQP